MVVLSTTLTSINPQLQSVVMAVCAGLILVQLLAAVSALGCLLF